MSAQATLDLRVASASRAARIRLLCERVRWLLLANEEKPAENFLIGPVADGLDRVALELDSLAGQQEMYEKMMD